MKNRIMWILNCGPFAIITATREIEGAFDCAANVSANRRLAERLVEYKGVEKLTGFYKGVAQGPSFLVPLIGEDAALRIARAFGQESILTDAGIVFTTKQATIPAIADAPMLFGADAVATGNYSTTAAGESFSLPL